MAQHAPLSVLKLILMVTVLDGAVNNRDLSTEKSESSQDKLRGAERNPGVDRAPTSHHVSNQRAPESRKNCGMWGIRAGARNRCCQQKQGVGVRKKNNWRPFVGNYRTFLAGTESGGRGLLQIVDTYTVCA